MPRFAVIIPAAGKAERFGGQQKKTFVKLEGRPVFLRTLEHFVRRSDVCQVILAVAPDDLDVVKSDYGANIGFMGVKLVAGGARRADSVAAALKFVPDEADFVAVHDAARPCVSVEMIDAVFAEAAKTGAAILAAPLTGTIKRVAGANVVEETLDRTGLYEAQTPQVFRKSLLTDAYAKLAGGDAKPTDDARVVELFGHPVSIVASDPTNLKVTKKQDLTLAAAILKSRPARQAPKLGAFEEAQW